MPPLSSRLTLLTTTDLTPFQAHCKKWVNGCGSGCCHGATKVFARGTVPCDVLFLGEAPGECISGDSLIDTAFRDKRVYPDGIPIRDLAGSSGFKVYSYDTVNKKLVVGTVTKVWRTGFKRVYEVVYSWWGAPGDGKGGRRKYYKSLKVTDNHQFLLKNGEYRSILQGLEVGNRLQPFYRHREKRRYSVGVYHGSMVKEAVFLMENKLGRSVQSGEEAHHEDRNPENDNWDNLILLDQVEHARLHALEDNAMFNEVHRETHRKAMQKDEYRSAMSEKMKKHLADPDAYERRLKQIRSQREQTSETVRRKFATDPVYYYRYLRGQMGRKNSKLTEEKIKRKMLERFPNEPYPPSDENHTVESITDAGIDGVYDMTVEGYHNFAVNGVFVHNSENAIGRPFVGPAGKMLDQIVAKALAGMGLTCCFGNVVNCIPRDEDGDKATEPDDDQILACQPRLQEFIDLCNPRLLVAVGKHAQDYTDVTYRHSVKTRAQYVDQTLLPKYPGARLRVAVKHPAYIIRLNVSVRALEVQRCIVQIRNAAETMLA